MEIEKKIEAILFWKGEPVKIKKLAEILTVDENAISEALISLEKNLVNRGLVLVHKEDEVTLGTATAISPLIEKLTKEELIRDLGKAGLETLSIIIYKGPISRADIDYIRGVQSTFILRNLSIRGLVERITNPKDQRSFLYKPTFELLQYLGVAKIEDMPEFEAVKTELAAFEAEKQAVKTSDNSLENASIMESPVEAETDTNIADINPEENATE